ncbi:MAG: hypothetical protein ACT4QD_18880 [Acidobacteriota bacterium]
MPRALLAVLAFLVLLEVTVIAPLPGAAALVATTLWMAGPGVVLARQVFARAETSGILAWLIGPALGLGFSVFGTFLVWAAGVQSWLAIFLGPGLTWLLALAVRRWGGPSLRLPAFDRRDVVASALLLLLVPAITWVPYDHVREPVADGEAYRAYFTADFVWAMTVTSELSKGDVPPVNPMLKGEPLRYYWMAHFLSGAVYRNVAAWGVSSEAVVLVNGLAFGLAFVAFVYALARLSGASAAWASLAVAAAFVANSYEGLNRLWVLSQQGVSLELLKTYNIDAVTRWFYQGMPVDGLQRLLLYQPHHLTGYVMALSALWLVGAAKDVTETSVASWAGVLLAFALLFSTFTAIILGLAVGLVFACRIVPGRQVVAAVQSAVLGGAPVAVGVGLVGALGYTDPRQGSLIAVGLNPVAVRDWGFMLLLSFGPLLLAGMLGLLRVRWIGGGGAAPAALVAAALAFYFLADVPDMGGVWVGWRAGHQLLIAFAVIGGAALTSAWRVTRLRWTLTPALVVATVAALPTVIIDIYNAQDITNRGPGPTFPWTLIVSPEEREALSWVRDQTPLEATIQPDPTARGSAHWGWIPAFGERRMAAGLPIAMIPLEPYQVASDTVRLGVFNAASAADAHTMARALGIDYLFVGEPERRAYPTTMTAIAAGSALFPVVFENSAATIFRVAP